jgi:YD repeat-containing protein
MNKIRTLQLLAFAAMAVILGSCAQNTGKVAESENVKHYRNILFTESPWDATRGTHQITAEEAKTINNYTFTYNDDGRLAEVTYGRGDVLLPDSRLGAARVVMNYEDNREIRTYFDTKGEPTTVNGDVFKAVYTMDDAGFRTGLRFYDKAGEPVENRNKIAYYKWSETIFGDIRENRYNLNDEETVLNEFCPFYELWFTYDEQGRVKRMANYNNDSLYDCTAENCGNIGVSYFDFSMDENGGLLSFSVHSTSGQLSNLYWGWARFEQTLDENGYVVERVMYDQDDELLSGKKVPITQSTYDDSGLLLERKHLDANRQLMEAPWDSVAVRQYKYDEYGQVVETILLDKEMKSKES